MMRSEFGVLARYDFQRSALAVDKRERERDVDEKVDWEERMWGREGVEVIVASEVGWRCFLGVLGGISGGSTQQLVIFFGSYFSTIAGRNDLQISKSNARVPRCPPMDGEECRRHIRIQTLVVRSLTI